MKTIMIEPRTKFLVCSDGITRHIDDFQLRELLQYKDAPANICQRMKDICYERGAEDNLTAVIAEVTDRVIQTPVVAAPPVELEEPTLASARVAPTTAPEYYEEEIPTQPLVMPSAETAAPRAVEPERIVPVVEPKPVVEESRALPAREAAREEKVYRVEEKRGGTFGNLLSSLLLLIVGAILGAGAYYLWWQSNRPAETPVITQMQSPNVEYTSFENLRRSVDADPNNYINKNAAITQDAEGAYLLGRAYLLTGKYPEARRAFEEAKNKLVQANIVNSKVLATDIALGLAIIDEAAAQNKFQSQIKTGNPEANLQGNTNGVRSGNF